MNVIVSNKQKSIIDNANIDAIKDLNGLFSVDDLVNKFKNYFFSKMILDATSVVDFATRDVLQKLTDEIGPDRLIILLPSTPEPPEEFKKLLIELKVYNFSNNIDDIVKFIEKPNTYENAMNTIANSYNDSNNFYVDSSIKEGEDEFESEDVLTGTDTNNTTNFTSLGDVMSGLNIYNNKDNVENNFNKEASQVLDENQTMDNIEKDDNYPNYDLNQEIKQEPIVNEPVNSHIFLNMTGFDDDYDKPKQKRIIGFKNITEHAGSTTLIYMLTKEGLKRKLDVISVEVNKTDFKLFRNNKMISVNEENLSDTLNSLREDIIFVDLNNVQDESICNDVIYLVEPSTIKLNKLMMVNKDVFNTLKGKKVILNQSMLRDTDIPILEKEADIKFFFTLGLINDRTDNSIISELFNKLLNE